ncbi:MAG: FAD-dependent oxidoreductase [Clostridia bacterium]|jgi:2,4-dienoyl-CoA reductase (NADPH2)|nr:FAD-dependent oxidoreductase [Clostridia bacterium]
MKAHFSLFEKGRIKLRLFEPIKIGTMELKNRVVMPAMHLSYTLDGQVNDRLIDFYVERAKGGAGLIIVGGCSIDQVGAGPWMIRLDHPRYKDGLKRLTEAVQAHGAKIAAQLYQAGRYAYSIFTGQQSVAPSPVASRLTGETPKELTKEEIQQIIESFAKAALLAKEAGFDAVEILGSAGYLISQFLSPLTNQRQDEYGGSWENRLRFPLAVVRAVKEAVGPDYPVIVRVAGNDFMPGSNTGEEARAFCRELEKAGVAAINVTGGWHETHVPQLTMNVPTGAFVYLARNIKQAVSIPVIACNRLNDPQAAEQVLATEQADLIGVARGFLADAAWAEKVRQGRWKDICPCIGCNQGCLDQVFGGRSVTCMTNPRVGREAETEILPASQKKEILVVGGGPAGMTAARVLALKGHRVTLWEQGERLGGQLHLAAAPPGRQDFLRLLKYLEQQLLDLDVKVCLGKKATKENVAEGSYQEVILATGAVEGPFPVAGTEGIEVVGAWDILRGKVTAGRQVVVVGGGPSGIETALYLALERAVNAENWHFLNWYQGEKPEVAGQLLYQNPRDITLVEMDKKAGKGLGQSTRWSMLADLKRLGIKTLVKHKVVDVGAQGVLVESGGDARWLPAQTVVVATGALANNSLHQELKAMNIKCHVIGDAAGPRSVLEAVREAFDLAVSM